MKGTIYFGDLEIGKVKNVIEHQGTYFADFECSLVLSESYEHEKLRQFLDLSLKFNQSLNDDFKDAFDDSEFDSFKDIIRNALWRIEFENGEQSQLLEALNMISTKEVSFVMQNY